MKYMLDDCLDAIALISLFNIYQTPLAHHEPEGFL